MKCQFCNNNFSSTASLSHHQKTAKYCLKKRGKISKKYTCEYCHKIYSTKQNMNIHITNCEHYHKYKIEYEYELKLKSYKEKLDQQEKQIMEQKQHIRDLEAKMENIAIQAIKRPTTTTTNTITDNRIQTINNLLPITDEHLREQAQFLTLDHIKEGPTGYARYAVEYPLKDRVLCVDFSRRKIKYKNKDGQVVTDPEMTVLSKKLFSAIDKTNTELIQEYCHELHERIYGRSDDELTEDEATQFQEETDALQNIITDCYSLRRQSREIADGKKPDMYHSFIKGVCSHTVEID